MPSPFAGLSRLGEFLRLGNRLFDGADHVERLLGQMVVVAVHQALEALDGVLDGHELAGRAGEHFGDVERLRKEALDLAGAGHRGLVVFRKLVHAEDRDDVLQGLVLLQDGLNLTCHLVMLVADDARLENARGRVERVHGRIDALLGDGAR